MQDSMQDFMHPVSLTPRSGGFKRSAHSAVPSLEAWRLGGLVGDLFYLFVCLLVLFCFFGYVFIACSPASFDIHECDGIYRYHVENQLIFCRKFIKIHAEGLLGLLKG